MTADVPMSGWVCREHTSQPVTWRGTGCTSCERDQGQRARRDAEARKASQEWDQFRAEHAATYERPVKDLPVGDDGVSS